MNLRFLDHPFPMVALYRAFDRDDEARRDLAAELLANPHYVGDAFAATRSAILPYQNPEPFYDTRSEHPIADALAATKDVALRLDRSERITRSSPEKAAPMLARSISSISTASW